MLGFPRPLTTYTPRPQPHKLIMPIAARVRGAADGRAAARNAGTDTEVGLNQLNAIAISAMAVMPSDMDIAQTSTLLSAAVIVMTAVGDTRLVITCTSSPVW